MKTRLVAAATLLLVACGDNSATNETATAENAAAPAGAAETEAPAPAGAAHVAIGRWVQESGRCEEMADVEFTETSVRMFGGPEGESFDLPISYSDRTATSVTMQAEPGQPSIVATLRDPDHLVLTSPGRPERDCTLVRR